MNQLVTLEDYTFNKSVENDLLKAIDPTHGGKLHPVHMVDKNGHHRLVYKAKEEIEELKQSGEHLLVDELDAGHRVHSDKDGKGTIVQTKGNNGNGHLVKVKFDNGKVTDRFVHNLNHINPLDETGEVTLKNVDTHNPNVGKNAESIDDEGGVDYEIYGTPTERLHRWDKLIKNFKEDRSRNYVVSYGTGGVGKAQPLYSKVLTPTGFKTIGEVEKGDLVTTPSGEYVKVLEIYPQGIRPVYELTFIDDSKVRCDEDHLWYVKERCNYKWVTVSVKQMLEKNYKKWRFGTPFLKKPVEFKIERKLHTPIHPYLLGLLLGDGCFSSKTLLRMTFGTRDKDFLIPKINECLDKDYKIEKIKSSKYDYSFVRPLNDRPSPGNKNYIIEYFESIGLQGQKSIGKFIPEDYFWLPSEQRLELIQGLMDSDGYVKPGGCTSFGSTSKRLSEDFLRLVKMFGGFGKISHSIKKTTESKKGYSEGWGVGFVLPPGYIPVTLPFKTERYKNKTHDKQALSIIDISYVGDEQTKCISIDHPDHLYITDNYIVTHNTYSVEKQMSQELENGDAVKFSGGTTPKGFLEMLYRNRDKKIILDDFDSSYEDENVLALLAICSRNRGERIIKDPTSGGMHEGTRDIPSEFEFTGKIMSISNMNLEQEAEGKGNKAQYFRDLLVNADRVNLKFSRKETWDLIDKNILHDSREMINGQPNPNLGGWNPNLRFKDAYGNKIATADEDRKDLFDYFNEGDSWKNMIELSGRTLTKANAIRNYYKDKGEDWKQYADALLKKDAPELDINQRYDIFQSSLDMLGKGDMKSAVVADRTADDIIEYYKDNGFRRSGVNGGFEFQDEMAENPSAKNGSLISNKDMAVVSGKNITVKSLYETLWKHNGKVIVFDKTAKDFLSDPIGQGILKGALDTSGDGEISWLTSVTTGNKKPSYKPSEFEEGGFEEQLKSDGFKFEMLEGGKVDMSTLSHPHDLPEKFAFKGRCIFVVNSLDESPQPVNSRSMMANINTTPNEFIQRAKYLADHREKKNSSFSTTFKNVGAKEYREAIDYLDKHKDWVNPMYYSEEGLQKVMGLMQERGDYSEERHAKEMRKDLLKGFDLDVFKAFKMIGVK